MQIRYAVSLWNYLHYVNAPSLERVLALLRDQGYGDVGAPLSHAAIVARELGIPAVVNCGNASARLHTGDRVRVDGVQGMVEILDAEA